MTRKINPKSLKNLTHDGRPTIHNERKTTHNISITPTGWSGLNKIAKSMGYSSVSEFIERVGRGEVNLKPKVDTNLTNLQNGTSLNDLLNRISASETRIKEIVEQKFNELSQQVNELEN
ncbi:MAG: hypothetical protein F6K14_05850 [Symploca sp. SIO2C1]|nr:hypothetical protein [Symploca sp. SIO2C1]